MSGYPVVPPSELEGVGISRELLDLTTTPQKTLFPEGLINVDLSYLNLTSAVGAWMFVVFDALSDADAATKLAVPEARVRILIGEAGAREFVFGKDTPCYRMDFASNVASETGDSVVRILGKVLS